MVSFCFISIGLTFASRMKDEQGFGLVMNFLVFPLFFFSGAIFPLSNLPQWLQVISFVDPLTYGIDALRACLLGASNMSYLANLGVLAIFTGVFLAIGTIFFETSESV